MFAEDAIAEMRLRFATHGNAEWMSAPENEEQVDFINEFAHTYKKWKTL